MAKCRLVTLEIPQSANVIPDATSCINPVKPKLWNNSQKNLLECLWNFWQFKKKHNLFILNTQRHTRGLRLMLRKSYWQVWHSWCYRVSLVSQYSTVLNNWDARQYIQQYNITKPALPAVHSAAGTINKGFFFMLCRNSLFTFLCLVN